MLQTSVVERCWRRVWEKSVVISRVSREALEREVLEKSFGEDVSEKSGGGKVGEECCRKVL